MQDDILVGAPVDGRSCKDFAPLVGYFVNALVLRGRLSDNPRFTAHLQQTRRTVAGALAHQDIPFPLLVERLQPHREAGRSPIFQAMFALQPTRDAAARALAPDGIGGAGGPVQWETHTVEADPLPHRIAQCDLALEMAEHGGAIVGSLEYDVDLFHASTAVRLVEQFAILLRSVVADPTAPVRSLSLVSSDEAHTQLQRWNRTERRYAPAATVVELWRRQVARHPDRLALVAGEVHLTYRQLDERARAMARRLRAAGIGPGAGVATVLPRSAEMIVAVLGVLQAGAAYVPIDPGTPERRIAFIVEDCAAACLLTATAQLERLPWLDCPIHCIDREGADAPPASSVPGHLDPAIPDHAAYVIYTSGTSGQPRGVVVRHRNLVHYVRSAAEAFAIGTHDRVLQFASLAFDTSVEEIFTTLTGGGALVLRDDGMLESAAVFLTRCGALGITVLDLPTAYWSELVTSASAGDWQQAAALRLVIIGGEKVTVERLRRWHEMVGAQVQLLNTYGPTETTVAATVADLTALQPAEIANMTEVSIGKPFPNCRIYILDSERKPVPIGAPGEIYIGGAGVAAGYQNAPELTATRFLPDPFAIESSAQLYRTGDKARYLADGAIQYLGRLDQQVEIRGYRVALGEIETALAIYPGVRAAAVVLDEGHSGEPRLVAYLESPHLTALSIALLRAFLKQRLPHYMVPALFVGLTALPRSPAGKVDRQLLPRPGVGNLLRDEIQLAARNPLESRMTEVWRRVLKTDRIGLHDNFFDVGGHSLLLPVLLSEIRKEFKRDVAMAALLEHSTISASAALFGASISQEELGVECGGQRASRLREMTSR
jgi:amino acid adenylation domain-containing protein